MIYMDNAATTMQKPKEVTDAVLQAMNSMGNAGERRAQRFVGCFSDDLRYKRYFGKIFWCGKSETDCVSQIILQKV